MKGLMTNKSFAVEDVHFGLTFDVLGVHAVCVFMRSVWSVYSCGWLQVYYG
jgi:hypothetical protein